MLTMSPLSHSGRTFPHRFFIPAGPFSTARFSNLAGKSTTPSGSAALLDCLTKTFEFPEPEALAIAARFPRRKSSPKPQALFTFLRGLGFAPDHMQFIVSRAPQILFAKADKTLKPKIELFQKLGLDGPRLGKFLSKNATVLTASLENKILPRIRILRGNFSEKDVAKAVERCSWLVFKYRDARLLSNLDLLKSCGIVGSQLAMLFRMQPRVFLREESRLRCAIARTVDFGFSMGSRMFAHGFYTACGVSDATIDRKFAIFEGFGFSRGECAAMFRVAPALVRTSDEKLRYGVEFFLNTMKMGKEELVRGPLLLMYSMERRVVPRYRVLRIMEAKGLFEEKKKPSFGSVVKYTSERFVEKFVFMSLDHAEELLMAYNGHNVDGFCDSFSSSSYLALETL